MKRVLVYFHILAFSLIVLDNFIFFNYLKDHSDYIKDKLSTIEPLRTLLGTIIIDFDYRKPGKKKLKDYYVDDKIVEIIGKKRASQQKLFFDHYRDNGSILSNSIIMADIVHEFMEGKIDTLFLPFTDDVYCFDIEETEWCQIQSIDLFVHPIIVSIMRYNPIIRLKQYIDLKNETNISITGSDDVLFNLVFHTGEEKKLNYYLNVYKNEVFVSSNEQ